MNKKTVTYTTYKDFTKEELKSLVELNIGKKMAITMYDGYFPDEITGPDEEKVDTIIIAQMNYLNDPIEKLNIGVHIVLQGDFRIEFTKLKIYE